MVPAPAQPVGLCAFLGGGCSRFWVGSEVVSGLRKLLYWPEAQVHSDGSSSGGWPELCQGPLPSHVLWPVACSQDSATSTAPQFPPCSTVTRVLCCVPSPYRHLVTDQNPVIATSNTVIFTNQYWGLLCWTLAMTSIPIIHPGYWMEESKNQRVSGKDMVYCMGSL